MNISKLKDLQNEKIKSLDNVSNFLEKIKKDNSKYNIVLNLYEDMAIERAKELDSLNLNEKKNKKLFGLVCFIKSVISKKDFVISCSSKTLKDYVGTYSSDVVNFLEDEGAIILGTLNCDEFACGSFGANSYFDKCLNPINPSIVCGGSSSGSAASVSAEFCDFSIGTDTGGSIRAPASHNFIYGIKPTYGLVSRYGLLDMAMSLDSIGVLSKDLEISKIVLEVISQKSENDSTKNNKEIFKCEKLEENKKYNIGIIKNLKKFIINENIKNELLQIENKLKKENHNILEFDIEKIDLAVLVYYTIVYCEFFSATRKYDGIKYGLKIEDSSLEEVRRRIFGGVEYTKAEHSGEYYKKALKIREILKKSFDKIFEKVDFIILPTLPILPPKIDKKLTIEEEYNTDIFTVIANLCHLCSTNVPIKIIEKNGEKIPFGFQIISSNFDEKKMFEGVSLIDRVK